MEGVRRQMRRFLSVAAGALVVSCIYSIINHFPPFIVNLSVKNVNEHYA